MIHIKKAILMLALLIAATTQAWAEDYLYLVIDDGGTSATLCYGEPEGNPYYDPDIDWTTDGYGVWDSNYDIRSIIKTVTIDESCQSFNGLHLNGLFYKFNVLTTIKGLDNLRTDDVENMSGMFSYCYDLATIDLSSFKTANVKNMFCMFYNCSKLETIYVGNGWSTTQVENSANMFSGCSKLPGYQSSNPTDKQMATLTTAGGFLTYKAPPTPVALTQGTGTDANQWSLTDKMPAGNVTVSVKYYEQAKFTNDGAPAAITGVQATTDNPIVTPGTPKTIGSSDVKMGTVKYYAAQSSSTAPTYTSDGWSEAVPTAATFSEGDVYVWYYIAGAEPASGTASSDANTCSDSDIKRLTVTLDAAPIYDVVINTAGLSAEEAGKWSASPNTGVKKGDEVTVTYTGSRKVIGVKAEKMGPTYKKWDKDQKKLVATEIPATATKVENANGDVTWSAGTYLVEGDVTIGGQIFLSGNVELIIKDDAKLTAQRIDGYYNYSLSVYGQTNMSGELNVAYYFHEPIHNLTALNIHSCKVNASCSFDDYGGFNYITEVNVYGGSLHAENTSDAHGYGMSITTLNIYGGEVKAVGMKKTFGFGYGIMADASGATVNVYGGKLWAECAGYNAIDIRYVTLNKDDNYTTGKIETSADGTSWTEYSGTGTPDAPYVRVGYSSAGAD